MTVIAHAKNGNIGDFVVRPIFERNEHRVGCIIVAQCFGDQPLVTVRVIRRHQPVINQGDADLGPVKFDG